MGAQGRLAAGEAIERPARVAALRSLGSHAARVVALAAFDAEAVALPPVSLPVAPGMAQRGGGREGVLQLERKQALELAYVCGGSDLDGAPPVVARAALTVGGMPTPGEWRGRRVVCPLSEVQHENPRGAVAVIALDAAQVAQDALKFAQTPAGAELGVHDKALGRATLFTEAPNLDNDVGPPPVWQHHLPSHTRLKVYVRTRQQQG